MAEAANSNKPSADAGAEKSKKVTMVKGEEIRPGVWEVEATTDEAGRGVLPQKRLSAAAEKLTCCGRLFDPSPGRP